MNVGTLRAILRLDKGDFDRSVEGVQKRLGKVGDSLIGMGKKASLMLTAPILLGFSKMASAAGDLNESVNAVNVVFGNASGKLAAFAEDADEAAGLSKRAFNELVTPIGAMLQNVGFSADEAADSSINLAKRAADMASVFNVDVSEALAAIQAGLRGEADPLERFGVGLSDAAVTAHALEMGLADTAAELDANAKSQARLSLLMKQTDRLAGDFVNTSDEAANAQRVAAAEAENLAAQLGQKLLPVKTRLIRIASSLLDRINNMSPAAQDMAIGAAAAAAALGPLLIAAGSTAKALAVLGPVLTVLTGPVGLAVAAVAALAAGLVYAYQESETFRRIVDRVFRDVAEGFRRTVGWVGEQLQGLGRFFGITRQTVGEEVAAMSTDAVGEMVDMVSGMTDQAHALARDGKTISADLAAGWIANVHKMRDDSIAAAHEQYLGVRQNAYNLAADLESVTAVQAGEVIANAEQQRDETVAAATEQAARVEAQITILRDRGVEISDDQAARIVQAMENQRDGAVAALLGQSEQAQTILAMLKAESGKISLEMAAESIANSANQRDTTIAAANKEYQDRVAAILAMKNESTTFTQEMADAAIAEARQMRDDSITAARGQHVEVVTEVKGMRAGVESEVDLMSGNVISDFDRMWATVTTNTRESTATIKTNTAGAWATISTNTSESWATVRNNIAAAWATIKGNTNSALATIKANTRKSWETVKTNTIESWSTIKTRTKGFVDDVVGFFRGLPGRIKDALSGLAEAVKDAFTFDLPSMTLPWNRGDGPGAPVGPGGRAMDVARRAATGLPVRMTSSYRSPAHNRAVGGSPTSYHLDYANPASDWVGPTWALDELAARLRASGPYRELLWRVANHAPGDNPHVHYAHRGGFATAAGIVPLRPDELLAKLQVGETVIPNSGLGGAVRGGDGAAADPRLLAALARVERQLDRIARGTEAGHGHPLHMDGRKVGDAVAPTVQETIRQREEARS